MDDRKYLLQAIRIAADNVSQGGQPFGAVLVRNGEVLAQGVNQTYIEHDPTAHAEIQALRNASRTLATSQHPETTMYASGIPCPMCMAAMISAGVKRVVYSAGDDEGAPYGWDTAHLYQRLQQPFGEQGIEVEHLPQPEKKAVYQAWQDKFGPGKNAPQKP